MKILEYTVSYLNTKESKNFQRAQREYVLLFFFTILLIYYFNFTFLFIVVLFLFFITKQNQKTKSLFLQQNSPKMLVFTVSARCVLFLKISRAFTNVIFSKFCPFTSIILRKVVVKYKLRQKQY